jgi:transposase
LISVSQRFSSSEEGAVQCLIFYGWRDAPREYGLRKTLYNRWKRWGDKGFFARIMGDLASKHGEEKAVMIHTLSLKARRPATSMVDNRVRCLHRAMR